MIEPDDLYREGCQRVSNGALLRFAEVMLDRYAAAGLEADDQARIVLSMLRSGDTLSAAKLGAALLREQHRTPKIQRTAWVHAIAMIASTARELHARRGGGKLFFHDNNIIHEAGSMIYSLGMNGRGPGSGRASHEEARSILAGICREEAMKEGMK